MSENMGRTLTLAGNARSAHSSGDNDRDRSVGTERAQRCARSNEYYIGVYWRSAVFQVVNKS
jgi:hypothetical protein